MGRELQVVGFAGSLRRGSLNRSLLGAAGELVPEGMTLRVVSLEDVPLYNGDVEEAGVPPGVARLRQAVATADGLLIATPEYNHGVPAVTKNAVDWLSRPRRDAALDGKPVAVLGASPASTGTARAQSQLRQSLAATNAPVMPQPQLLISRAHEKLDDAGRLTDEATRQHLVRFLAAFAAWIDRFRDRQEGGT